MCDRCTARVCIGRGHVWKLTQCVTHCASSRKLRHILRMLTASQAVERLRTGDQNEGVYDMLANDIVNGQRETVTVSSVSPGGTHRRETHTPCGELVLSPGFSQLVSPKVFPAAKTAPSLGRPGSRARPTLARHPWARHNPGVSDPRQGPAAMHSLSSSSASVGSPTSLDTQPAGPARGVAWLPPVREDVEANDDVLPLPAVREDVGEDGAALSLGDSAGRGCATREPPSSRAQPPSLDIETAEECVGQLGPSWRRTLMAQGLQLNLLLCRGISTGTCAAFGGLLNPRGLGCLGAS